LTFTDRTHLTASFDSRPQFTLMPAARTKGDVILDLFLDLCVE